MGRERGFPAAKRTLEEVSARAETQGLTEMLLQFFRFHSCFGNRYFCIELDIPFGD